MSKPCKYCGFEIFWSQEDDRWVPYEDEARTRIHDCPQKPRAAAQTESKPTAAPPAKKVPVQPLSDKEIIFVRKFIHEMKLLTEGFE